MNIEKRTLGISFDNNEQATLKVWAPKAESVAVKLSQSDKILPLVEQDYGYYSLTTDKIKPDDHYTFVLDGDKELPDPASLSQSEGVHNPSQAVDLSQFSWTDKNWKNHSLKEYIIYEVHIGTFTHQGTFQAAEEKLDYLVDLGINAVEIMPISQFPGGRNWGYDGVYPFAVQNSYGGAESFQSFVNACHNKGIAVILDVVYNHLGPEGNYLNEYGYYFTDKYQTPWGKALNFDDAWSDAVREYFLENTLMWFRDFHVDAFRMDAVHAIKDSSPKHILQEIREHVDKLQEYTGKEYYLTIEFDLNDNKFINPISRCGYGMDAQWIDEFHHALRVTSGEKKTGYYSDFDGINHLAKAYNDAYVFDGIYSPHRKRHFGTRADGNPGEQFIAFSQNHDHVGNRMLGERTSELVSFEMQKVMAAAVIFSPYIPMLFMGEEWSASSRFQYFVSHNDKGLIEAVRKGRKAEFKDFHAKGEAPDPQAQETFERSKLKWSEIDQGHHHIMWSFYKRLLDLRKNNTILKELDRKCLNVQVEEDKKALSLYRWNNKEHMVALFNYSNQKQEIQFPFKEKSEWKKILDSAAPEWNGPGASEDIISGGVSILLHPQSVIVYQNKK